MAENVFEAVKHSVSTRDAAAFYGIEVKRNGMACCPFHDDKNPSMKVDQRFHCFGCGEDGDVIDFTAKLLDLSPKEAAEKLAQDFGLIYDSQAPPRRRYVRQKTEAQKFREDRQRCYRVLSDYYYLLKKWEADRSPRTPEEEPHSRFVEAIQKKTYVEYLLDIPPAGRDLTVIDQDKVLCQFLRRFFWGEVKELCGKVDHIPICTAAKAVEPLVYLHTGVLIIVKGTAGHTISFDLDPIKRCRFSGAD